MGRARADHCDQRKGEVVGSHTQVAAEHTHGQEAGPVKVGSKRRHHCIVAMVAGLGWDGVGYVWGGEGASQLSCRPGLTVQSRIIAPSHATRMPLCAHALPTVFTVGKRSSVHGRARHSGSVAGAPQQIAWEETADEAFSPVPAGPLEADQPQGPLLCVDGTPPHPAPLGNGIRLLVGRALVSSCSSIHRKACDTPRV